MSEQFTPVAEQLPPKDAPIEWITPSGQIVRGRWAGGACWFPEGSNMYVYYTPISWRLAAPESNAA
jgi:hypothetical protein